MKTILVLFLAHINAEICDFKVYDYADSDSYASNNGWTILSHPDLQNAGSWKEPLINYLQSHNTKIQALNGWDATNCCMAYALNSFITLNSDSFLKVSSDTAGCSACSNYITNTWYNFCAGIFIKNSITLGDKFNVITTCTDGKNAAFWVKCTNDTAAPTTSNPTTSNPTTFNPTTFNPTTSNPTTFNPTTFNPSTSNPTTTIPTTATPTTYEPTTSIPTTNTPTNVPTTSNPTTTIPTTSTPTTYGPTTSIPTTNIPTTYIPTNNPIKDGSVPEHTIYTTRSFDGKSSKKNESTNEMLIVIIVVVAVIIFVIFVVIVLFYKRKQKRNKNNLNQQIDSKNSNQDIIDNKNTVNDNDVVEMINKTDIGDTPNIKVMDSGNTDEYEEEILMEINKTKGLEDELDEEIVTEINETKGAEQDEFVVDGDSSDNENMITAGSPQTDGYFA